ncbi:hypothetical protein M422DRAFT_781973 [Sphaerobolus stellatus SS14]|uniref:3-oxoacyl-[acyl-carrier-protein] reductase n=1 Tax=Sphaerobolus stellatus (strain SS14) TaxID=990650 RepID=A0A0C9V5T6_SPHS4|nr:hypothetical protein M422DRAFT_781973 [Sphaerobolus stellatus SS14]
MPPHGQVAVVTAAAQGVGRAIALRLASDGLEVLVTDLFSRGEDLKALALEIQSKGRACIAVTGELSEEQDVGNLIEIAVRELGSVDIMVVNDGIGPSGPIVSMNAEEWDQVIKFNLRSVFLCYRAAAKQMIKQGRGGRIVAASSISGKQGASEFSAYSTSKFGIRGLTQSAAGEWRPHGITVNTYAPGAVDVPRFHEAKKEQEDKDPQMQVNYPVVSPADIGGLVSYLVSEEAKFVTGQSYGINGGMNFD